MTAGASRPLRILLVAETSLPYVSGVTVATDALARGLGAAGHEVMLLAPAPADPVSGAPATVGGPAPTVAWLPSVQLPPPAPRGYRVPIPGRGALAMRAARAFAPDVVHVQSPFGAGLRGRSLARRLDVPLVFTHHTRFADYRHYLGPLAGTGGPIVDRWLAAYWRSCDAVIAPGEDLAAEIRLALGPRSRPRVVTIPTGIDVAAIAALAAVDPRRAADWPDDAIVAVTLGRLAAEKSVDLVLDAVAAVPGVRLVIIGDGPSGEALRHRARRADLANRVWFAGMRPREEALALLRGGDLFLVASRSETQGLVVAEALAGGVPVVAIDAPGIRDAVRAGIDGVLVPPAPADGAAARLADAIHDLVADTPRRAAMAAAATAGASRFALAGRIAEVIDLYGSAIVARR